MDIGRSPNGTVVIQYVNPVDFDRLLRPLQDAVPGEETQPET
jgi:hypothetical protein